METELAQIAQQVNHLSRPQGHLLGQPEANPKGHMNAITLQSGKQLDEPKVIQAQEGECVAKEKGQTPLENEVVEVPNDKEQGIHEEDPRPRVVEPYRSLIPFPQRLAKAKLEAKLGKFLEILKMLQINTPFLDAISEMLSYAKFLKEILSNKRMPQEHSMVSLTEECSAILHNKLPPKLEDLGSFSIPCAIGDVSISRALCDLGESVSLMPYSICKWLEVGELKSTIISIQLADRSVKYPIWMLVDVLCK